MIYKYYKRNAGYSVIELIFYISLFVIIAIAVINSLFTMTKSLKEVSVQSELASSSAIMERISRETRKAIDINSISSNDIILKTTDDVGASKTVEFHLSGTNLQLLENGVLTGNLNSASLDVTAVNFTQITTLKGKAVKITFSVKSSNDRLARVIDFYDTIALRGLY